MPRIARQSPREFSRSWPDEACEDTTAEVARRFAQRLRSALGGDSLRSAKARTGIDHTVLSDILNGLTWPELATIARLEHGLDADLWPGRIEKRTAQ
ncbi:MAG: hypothetical protein M3Y42_00630 [Actinomycetota bacterium]|nr:hypothetical protein [Actinomycetota bacterium]MDQ2955456.1 hypothetical protein [Actinomycetota bacterium]